MLRRRAPAQASHFYLGVCTAQLDAEAGSGGHPYQWLLGRHLAVAALGEAAAHLRLGQPGLAVRSLDTALAPLRGHARAVFGRTVGVDPARYLIPATAAHGLTLDGMAELYRQAGLAGVRPDRGPASGAALFEGLRDRLPAAGPLFGKARAAVRLAADYARAVGDRVAVAVTNTRTSLRPVAEDPAAAQRRERATLREAARQAVERAEDEVRVLNNKVLVAQGAVLVAKTAYERAEPGSAREFIAGAALIAAQRTLAEFRGELSRAETEVDAARRRYQQLRD